MHSLVVHVVKQPPIRDGMYNVCNTIGYLERSATWLNSRCEYPKTAIFIRSTVISDLDKINKQMR